METDKSKLMKTAWMLAKQAAAKFGGSVKSFFSESLKQAWRMIMDKIQAAIDARIVTKTSEFKKSGHDRIYLTLKGFSWDYAGCKSTKVYRDNKTDELIVTRGKGIATSEFEKNLVALKAIFA